MVDNFKVLTVLKTAKIGPKLWILLDDMLYDTPMGRFRVPAGYLTDHASVPRAFTSIVPPVQSCVAEASILHDWFYNTDSKDVPRDFADECIKELCIARGGSKLLGRTTWAAVRVGGGGLYNKAPFIDKLKTEAYPEFQMCTQGMLMQIFNLGEYNAPKDKR